MKRVVIFLGVLILMVITYAVNSCDFEEYKPKVFLFLYEPQDLSNAEQLHEFYKELYLACRYRDIELVVYCDSFQVNSRDRIARFYSIPKQLSPIGYNKELQRELEVLRVGMKKEAFVGVVSGRRVESMRLVSEVDTPMNFVDGLKVPYLTLNIE